MAVLNDIIRLLLVVIIGMIAAMVVPWPGHQFLNGFYNFIAQPYFRIPSKMNSVTCEMMFSYECVSVDNMHILKFFTLMFYYRVQSNDVFVGVRAVLGWY
uniref:Uncharacterized protein n=1 Tax=Cacopsylla melanoneura TaxID=428564 RepID=A0A8D8XHR5_9HEMI